MPAGKQWFFRFVFGRSLANMSFALRAVDDGIAIALSPSG
jgi:hypothetical protein